MKNYHFAGCLLLNEDRMHVGSCPETEEELEDHRTARGVGRETYRQVLDALWRARRSNEVRD